MNESAITSLSPFKGLIFDLDGTLLDTMPDLVHMTNAALRAYDMPERTYEEIHSFVGNGARALMYQAVPSDTPSALVNEVMQYWKDLYPEMGVKLTAPYPDIMEVLQELKTRGCKLAVLSNKFHEGVVELVDAYFPQLFDVVYGECDSIPRKPDPTGLLRVVSELDLAASQVAYVGDSPGDMVVSVRAQVFSLGVSWGYRSVASLKEAGAKAVVTSASDFLKFV